MTRTLQTADRNATATGLVVAWVGVLLATAMSAFALGVATSGMDFQFGTLIGSMAPWLLLMATAGLAVFVVAVALLARRTLRALRGDGDSSGA